MAQALAKNFTWDQFSTVRPLLEGMERNAWLTDEHRTRLNAYLKYEQIYWSDREAFRLFQRSSQLNPVYVPDPKTICDTTSHFYLKGLSVSSKNSALQKLLDPFLKREKFYSRFMVAKHSGVIRGDYVLHLTADPDKPDGDRVSLTSVDPARYFPVTDDDDLDKIVKIHLAEFFYDAQTKKDQVRRLTYWFAGDGDPDEDGSRVWRQEAVYDADEKWMTEAKRLRWIIEPEPLEADIVAIPVYHIKNVDFQGDEFGSSELRGYERLQASMDQTLTDEEMALALEGLGVYATDAGAPEDNTGKPTDWEISPARVMEVPAGSYFNRVKGIEDVAPFLDHVRFLKDSLMESSATFRAGSIDASVAQSGISLAIKFLPTIAKLEQRDLAGVDALQHVWHDWQRWQEAYEGDGQLDAEIDVEIGDKLPMDRTARFAELNNMHDRKIISNKTYREEVKKLFGWELPDDEDERIAEEAQAAFERQQANVEAMGLASGNPDNPNEPSIPPQNRSNNAGRTNESNGNEAHHSLGRQQRPPARR